MSDDDEKKGNGKSERTSVIAIADIVPDQPVSRREEFALHQIRIQISDMGEAVEKMNRRITDFENRRFDDMTLVQTEMGQINRNLSEVSRKIRDLVDLLQRRGS